MGTEHVRSIPRTHTDIVALSKKASPAKVKKTVSVASIFRKRDKQTNQRTSVPQTNHGASDFCEEDANATTLLSLKPHSSPRSAAKKRPPKRTSDRHPLSVAFKEASDDYRKHLYKTTSLKINKTLTDLLTTLHESTLQTIVPNSHEKSTLASPLKLSAPAKYERLASQLYQPISQFTLRLRRTDSEGRDIRFAQTLEIRMLHYEELIAVQTEKVAQLQKEWEAVVGEIWKLGVGCLGESAMQHLLFTEEQRQKQSNGSVLQFPLSSSSPSKTTDAESTLFVPEQGTSPLSKKKKSGPTKKRVTFLGDEDTQGQDRYGASLTTSFPKFLYQPSRYPFDQALYVPRRELEKDIKRLDQEIEEMGTKQINDFANIEKEQRAFWKKKTAQLARALREE